MDGHRSMMAGWSCSIRKGDALMDHRLHSTLPLPQNHRDGGDNARARELGHGRNEVRNGVKMVACGRSAQRMNILVRP